MYLWRKELSRNLCQNFKDLQIYRYGRQIYVPKFFYLEIFFSFSFIKCYLILIKKGNTISPTATLHVQVPQIHNSTIVQGVPTSGVGVMGCTMNSTLPIPTTSSTCFLVVLTRLSSRCVIIITLARDNDVSIKNMGRLDWVEQRGYSFFRLLLYWLWVRWRIY